MEPVNSKDIEKRLNKVTVRIEELNGEIALCRQELEKSKKERILLEKSYRQALRIEEDYQRRMSALENELNGNGEKEDMNAEDY